MLTRISTTTTKLEPLTNVYAEYNKLISELLVSVTIRPAKNIYSIFSVTDHTANIIRYSESSVMSLDSVRNRIKFYVSIHSNENINQIRMIPADTVEMKW